MISTPTAMLSFSSRASGSLRRCFSTSPTSRALTPDGKVILNRYSRTVTAPKSQGASQVGFEARTSSYFPSFSPQLFGFPTRSRPISPFNRFGFAVEMIAQMLIHPLVLTIFFFDLYRPCSTRLKESTRNPTSTRPWLELLPSGELPRLLSSLGPISTC